MKKYILVLVGFLAALQLNGQTDILNFKLSTKGHKKVIPITSKSGSIHYVFVNKTEIEFHWFEGNEARVFTIPFDKQTKKSIVVTSIATNEQILVYLWEHKSKKIDVWVVNKQNRSFVFKELITLSSNEELLKIVKDVDKVHILIANPNNILKVATHFENIITTKEYEIPYHGFFKAISEDLKNVSQDVYGSVGITQISHDVANNLRTTLPLEKMYFISNILYFSFDDNSTTHLIRIFVKEQQCDYKKLNFKLEKAENRIKGNSFLINNRLMRVTANQSQLNMCIIDLDSFYLVKNYNLYQNEDFEIKNTQIITENNDVPDSDFLTPRDFFKNIMEGNIAIAANMVDNNYEICLGSEEQITIQRPSFGPGGNFPVSVGFGLVGGLMMSPGFGNQGVNTSYTLTTSFKTLMSSTDFTHVSGSLSKNIIDKLRIFEDKAFGDNIPEIHTVYKYKQKIQYGYITKWNNSFNVVEF